MVADMWHARRLAQRQPVNWPFDGNSNLSGWGGGSPQSIGLLKAQQTSHENVTTGELDQPGRAASRTPAVKWLPCQLLLRARIPRAPDVLEYLRTSIDWPDALLPAREGRGHGQRAPPGRGARASLLLRV